MMRRNRAGTLFAENKSLSESGYLSLTGQDDLGKWSCCLSSTRSESWMGAVSLILFDRT